MQKIKLMDIVIDPTIQVREVKPFTVSKYAQAMKAGAQFPPLLLEEKTNRVVCGNNRYFAYKSAFDPDYEITVEFRRFKDDAEIIRVAAKDNSTHGAQMDTWDCKRIASRLIGYGDTPEQIAEVLSIPVKKIETWSGMNVIVIGNKAKGVKTEALPVKNSLSHMAGQKIKAADYEAHSRSDLGTPVKNLAAMITRHIKSGLINTEDHKTMENLTALHSALGELLKEVAA